MGDLSMPRFGNALSRRPGNPVLRFLNDCSGTATVEFVLVVPLFMLILMLTADASALYLQQTKYWNITRDTARAVSRHGLTDVEAVDFARDRASTSKVAAEVTVVIVNNMVTVTISGDAAESSVFGITKFAVGDRITASTTNIMEPI
jgi:Flp pilus assembly protein TadG